MSKIHNLMGTSSIEEKQTFEYIQAGFIKYAIRGAYSIFTHRY